MTSHRQAQIFIIDDDPTMQLCLRSIIGQATPCTCFTNVIDALDAIDAHPPQLIFLDLLLDGPDGFTLLNELASYSDLSTIPVVLMSNVKIPTQNLRDYGVVAILDKATMRPAQIQQYVEEYCHDHPSDSEAPSSSIPTPLREAPSSHV